jgi:hypothetical protein
MPAHGTSIVWCAAGEGADLIIYVTSAGQDCDALAQASPCYYDAATNRPVAGEIQFCKIGEQPAKDQLITAVHELMHVLVRIFPTSSEIRLPPDSLAQ